MPTADHYAHALVAAARHTGENPESFVDGSPEAKFRHYAFHALLAVFPKADRTDIAAALRAPGKASYFHRTSLWHVLGDGPHRKGPIEWWDSVVLELTIIAVERIIPKSIPAKVVPWPIKSPGFAKSGPILKRPAVTDSSSSEAPAPRTGLDRFATRYGGNADQLTTRALERRECRDLLAEAAANTAKLQAKLPKE